MIQTVPGTSNPFLRCGGTMPDSTMPELSHGNLEDFKHMLHEFFGDKPEILDKKIDDCILRFETEGKIFGGHFIGILFHGMTEVDVLAKIDYDQWGIKWFPTFRELLSLVESFLETLQRRNSIAA